MKGVPWATITNTYYSVKESGNMINEPAGAMVSLSHLIIVILFPSIVHEEPQAVMEQTKTVAVKATKINLFITINEFII